MIVDGKPHRQRREPRGIKALRARLSSFQVLISRDSFPDSTPVPVGTLMHWAIGLHHRTWNNEESPCEEIWRSRRSPGGAEVSGSAAVRCEVVGNSAYEDVLWKPYFRSRRSPNRAGQTSPEDPCVGNYRCTTRKAAEVATLLYR